MGRRSGSRAAGALAALLLLGGCSPSSDAPAADGTTPATADRSRTPSPTPSGSPEPSAGPDDPAPYAATVRRIGPDLRERMRSSHRPGCPVPLRDLRHLRMSYVGYDGVTRTGEMVVHREHAVAVTEVFGELYDARWPLRRMRLVDAYGGDDDASMAADNTSGYNCRRVAGTDRWSEHAYGAAVDLNPVRNPYVRGDAVDPPAGRRFAGIDRSPGARVPEGVIRSGDVVVRAFARIGWEWGGDWTSALDYQHFSASGR